MAPFADQVDGGIPMELKDHPELVDRGGREVKRNKRGSIPAYAHPILLRPKMDTAQVLDYLANDRNTLLNT